MTPRALIPVPAELRDWKCGQTGLPVPINGGWWQPRDAFCGSCTEPVVMCLEGSLSVTYCQEHATQLVRLGKASAPLD